MAERSYRHQPDSNPDNSGQRHNDEAAEGEPGFSVTPEQKNVNREDQYPSPNHDGRATFNAGQKKLRIPSLVGEQERTEVEESYLLNEQAIRFYALKEHFSGTSVMTTGFCLGLAWLSGNPLGFVGAYAMMLVLILAFAGVVWLIGRIDRALIGTRAMPPKFSYGLTRVMSKDRFAMALVAFVLTLPPWAWSSPTNPSVLLLMALCCMMCGAHDGAVIRLWWQVRRRGRNAPPDLD